MRADAHLAAVDGAYGEAEELEIGFVRGRFGDALHPQARRLLVVRRLADHVAEAVVDIVHGHERCGGERIVDDGVAGFVAGISEHGVEQLTVASGGRRSDRHPPPLRRRERAGLQHALQIELGIARVLRHTRAQRFDGAHDAYAAPSVCWPGRQLHGQSSSLCRASSARITSSTLRPTDRSFALTQRMMPFGSTMYVTRSAAPASG